MFALMGHLAISGNIFGSHNWEGATGIYWVEARDVAKHPTMHSAPTNKKSPNPTFQ